jgi:hypothetical protein
MIQILWRRHYHAGITGSYHGDMAHAFKAMLADTDCGHLDRRKMLRSIDEHKRIERGPRYVGRQWFCETFSKTVAV